MIKGYLDQYGQPKIKLITKGLQKQIAIEAVIDTGFNGELCLPTEIAVLLGLELAGREMVELADGSMQTELFFIGKVILEKDEFPVQISLSESDDALLGTGLLKEQKLEIGFASGTVRLEPEIL